MTKTLNPLALAAALAFGSLAAAPAQASVVFQQDFSSGLTAAESVGGIFAVANGHMGHVTGIYTDNERSFYQLTVDLTGLTDALFSFDWDQSIENGWDGWNLLAASHGSAFDPHAPLVGTPPIYNHFVNALDTMGATGVTSGRAVFDLTPYAGKTVDLRLQFASDASRIDRGVVFDNLVVSGTQAPMSAVPEPATWALMLMGFFGAGAALRHARRRPAALGAL
jgi:hypothetical protein